MRLSLRNQKENIFYLILWLVLFAAPVLTSYIRSTTGEEIPVHWPEIFHVWKIFAVFLIIFLIHNFVLAPLLVYKERKRLYLATTGCLVAVFVLFNCYSSHRKEGGRPAFGPRMEVNDKMPPPMAEEPNLQGDNERPPFQKPRGPKPGEMPPGLPLLLTQGGIVNSLFLILLLGMNIGVKLYFKSDCDRKQMLVLERENIESQLEYLKYQINPHFFMNTLNNIHALVDIDPEKAKDTILELSKMMRFVLYEGNKHGVPLNREFDFIRNYITLMRLRYTDKVKITVELPTETPDKLVPPLMLITFIENAFKHGISYQHESFIEVKVEIEQEQLRFRCRNSKADKSNQEKGGVGLANVKQRLHLLYDNNFTLHIQDEPDIYNVELTIPLA